MQQEEKKKGENSKLEIIVSLSKIVESDEWIF